jgi:hypothetical protein
MAELATSTLDAISGNAEVWAAVQMALSAPITVGMEVTFAITSRPRAATQRGVKKIVRRTL